MLQCGIHSIANDNQRIMMIKVNIMSLGLGVYITMRSGYFHFGNNHFLSSSNPVNMCLRSLITVMTQAINNIQADTSTQSRT